MEEGRKAQSVSTFCMGHHADRLDWHSESVPQAGSEELWDSVHSAGL